MHASVCDQHVHPREGLDPFSQTVHIMHCVVSSEEAQTLSVCSASFRFLVWPSSVSRMGKHSLLLHLHAF